MREELERRVLSLENDKALMFGVFVSRRLIRSFEEFSAKTGHMGISILHQAIYYAWAAIERVEFGQKITSERCFNAAPDSEEFRSLLTSSAINAANACGVLVDFANSLTDNVLEISQLSIDGVDLLIQNQTDKEILDIDSYINSHPVMIREINWQFYLINLIENLSLSDLMDVNRLYIEVDREIISEVINPVKVNFD